MSHPSRPESRPDAERQATFIRLQLPSLLLGVEGLNDARVKRLLGVIEIVEDAEFSRRFPAERWARVRISLADGDTLVSEPARARGNPENPLSDGELRDKYHASAEPVLGRQRTARIASLSASLVDSPPVTRPR